MALSKNKCVECRSVEDTIQKNNEAATAVRKVLDSIPRLIGEQIDRLKDALVAYKDANVALNQWLATHDCQGQ